METSTNNGLSNALETGNSAQGDRLKIGSFALDNRLILGTGRFDSFELMRSAHAAAETQCVTIAVRREKLHDSQGRNILEFIDLEKVLLLPNTSGCYDAKTAVRVARMGREILEGLQNPGARWVKLEVLGDSRTLLPDPLETLKATESLVELGFEVLVYTSDDPVLAWRLFQAGAKAVMPAGSPIGSGQGIANPLHLEIILEQIKGEQEDFPIIVDAGIGTASDASMAMECGADGVLLNTAIARAGNPILMARAMKLAVESGRLAHQAKRIPTAKYGSASSPETGTILERID